MKKCLCWLLVMIMVAAMTPLTVFATSPESVDYVNTATPIGYVAAEGEVTTWVDITEAHTAVLGSDGYYHLDSADGDIIIVKITADNPYGVNLPGAVTEGRLKFPVYENGSIVRYDVANDAFTAYINAASDGWVYLTSDLIHIYKGYGAGQGWYMVGFSYYLDGVDFDPDTAWMLSCATISSAASDEEDKEDEEQQPVPSSPETVTYVNTATPTGYVAAEGEVTTWVDITEAHTAVLGSDGYYHLDSADGNIIIVKITADNPYGVNLPGAVTEGRLKFPVYENGSIVRYDIANDAFTAYIEAANDGWVYLTNDLIHIYKGYGTGQGWYMSGLSYYLSGVDFDADTAWMLSCATVSSDAAEEEAVKGDVDGDGKVDNDDVAHLLWFTLFGDKYVLNGEADFNGDDVIDDADVAYLLWHTLFPEDYPI